MFCGKLFLEYLCSPRMVCCPSKAQWNPWDHWYGKNIEKLKYNASSIIVYLNRIDTFSMLMALILFLDWMSFAICKRVKSVWKDFACYDQLESLKTCRGKVRKSRSSIFCFSCTSSCSLVERVNENMWIVAVAFLRERLESESDSRERLTPTWPRRW